MKTTADYLDELRTKLNLPSDGRLADYLGVQRQHMSRYRTRSGTFDEEMSIRIADILGEDPSYIFACMQWQRAKAPKIKAVWKHTAEMLGGLAAVLAVVAILPTSTLPDFGGFFALTGYSEAGTLYIMSNAMQYWPILLPLALLAFWLRPKR